MMMILRRIICPTNEKMALWAIMSARRQVMANFRKKNSTSKWAGLCCSEEAVNVGQNKYSKKKKNRLLK